MSQIINDYGTFAHSARELLCIFCESPANKMRRVANLMASVQTMKQLTPVATMADQHTMSELLQAPTEGYRDVIVIQAILADNFELKNVLNEAIKLMLFPFSIDEAAWIWLEKQPPHSILTWEVLVSKFVNQLFPPSNTTNLMNDITRFQQKIKETFSEAWDRFKDLLRKFPHHGFLKLHQIDTFYNALTQSDQDSLSAAASRNLLNRTPRDALKFIENKLKVRISQNKPIVLKLITTTPSPSHSLEIFALTEMVREILVINKANQQAIVKAVEETCVTFGRPHPYYECSATNANTFDACASVRSYNQGGNRRRPQGDLNYRASNQMGPPSFPSSNVQNNQNYKRNTIANSRGDLKAITTQSGVSYDGPTLLPTSSLPPKEVVREPEVTKDKVQPTSSESTAHIQPPVVQVPIQEADVAPKPNSLHFDISFLDALLHMPKFDSTFNNLLSNKEILFELANVNENCLAVLLQKLPEKFGDPGKFHIPCDFPDLDECLALANLRACINLIPLSIWKKLSLPEHTLTRMTVELANRSIVIPTGVAEDVFVKVGNFYFLPDFVVVDYDVDPWVLLILGRPFLMTARALIDVYGEELTLRFNDEAITFKVEHTSRYSYNNEELVNRIDVIDVACEEYVEELPGFLDNSKSGNPTPSLDPIITTSSPSFTPFDGGDILLLEKLLNNDPSSPPPLNELHFKELKRKNSSIDDALELKLKDSPSHLEYAFLEGIDKLPVIIYKELKDEEKAAFSKVFNSYKSAIAWKISDIKGIDSHFCTHKILMEDDFKPAVQHQRTENSKIHEVIKKEVIKHLDAGLIYPISDSPLVSPVHCVLKKGGMIVAENEENELIPTRLVTGWRTRKTKIRLPSLALMGCLPTDVRLSAYLMLQERFKVLGKRKTKYFQPIHYASKTMTDAQAHYTTTEKELLAVVAKNLMADHLSRLENPNQGDLEKKEINETFPLEAHGVISSYGDSSTPMESTSWAHSRLLMEISTVLWPLTTCQKWVEAKELPTNDAQVVVKFLKYLFARFGTPRSIIRDRGTYFCNDQFAKVMLKYGVTHCLSTTYHPQTSEQVEISNHGLKGIFERTVGENRSSSCDKLDDALWAFRTTFKTSIGCTPYKLVCEKACLLPIELEHKAYWALNIDCPDYEDSRARGFFHRSLDL
uniref:DNA-directed DNA polymerase n=1 Tax=Tanacetum cinerariifolium TaxID=118510 RepID=A0A699GXM1_TANCI|nr:DNA-directed DNA polymerase [Tanacetum cinerariifolium]